MSTLSCITGEELDCCSFSYFKDLHSQKGKGAQVKSSVVDEFVALASKWSLNLPNQLSYVHGDLHFGNLLYDGKSVKIIDFEEAIRSHPIIDATSLSWDIMDCFGQAMYEYFKKSYQSVFHAELIDLAEWKRFCQLRDWICGRYLENCCTPEVKQHAYNFIVETEPNLII